MFSPQRPDRNRLVEASHNPTKFRFLSTSKEINKNMYINTFYDELCYKFYPFIGFWMHEYPKIKHKLTSEILHKHKNITKLNINGNCRIHDEDIKHLNLLSTLYTNSEISDEGIKDMKLHTCYAFGNKYINNKYNNIILLY